MLLDLIDLVSDDDLRALHDHLDGSEAVPTGGVQPFLFRLADEEASLVEVRDHLAETRFAARRSAFDEPAREAAQIRE